jgi:hypothetical protein
MALILESGKLRLSTEEVASYRAAADRLHESCQRSIHCDLQGDRNRTKLAGGAPTDQRRQGTVDH